MKICVVSRGDLDIFPPTQGGSVKIYSTIKFLSLLGHKVYFVSAENEKYFEVVNGVLKEKNYPKFLAKSPTTKPMKKMLLGLGVPPSIHVLYHPLLNFNLWLKTLYVAIKEKVDVLQAEFTAFAIPAIFTKLFTGKPTCLVEHNVESFQMPEVSRLSERGKKLIRFVEKTCCKLCDFVIATIPADKRRLVSLGINKNKIFVIPHGVDLNKYRKLNGKKIRKKYKLKHPTLIFHGVLSYEPNKYAAKMIADKILPELERMKRKFHGLVVGDFPPLGVDHPNLIFTGVVKNLPDYIDAADIAIVPLQAGGGMRMKILEYFAAKKPVVSTKKGAEGIGVNNGEGIILTDIESFPKEIMRLVKSKKLRKRLTKNAFKFVQNHDWKKICQKYVDLYNKKLRIE